MIETGITGDNIGCAMMKIDLHDVFLIIILL